MTLARRAVLVSSCKGRIFTTVRSDDFLTLCDLLEIDPTDREHAAWALSQRCAAVLREISRGRGREFARDVQGLTRFLLELGTIANEAGDGVVDVQG
mgnify:CR=1 FL=1